MSLCIAFIFCFYFNNITVIFLSIICSPLSYFSHTQEDVLHFEVSVAMMNQPSKWLRCHIWSKSTFSANIPYYHLSHLQPLVLEACDWWFLFTAWHTFWSIFVSEVFQTSFIKVKPHPRERFFRLLFFFIFSLSDKVKSVLAEEFNDF